MHASLSRKASNKPLDFNRIDYPDIDPPEWGKFVTTKLDYGDVKVGNSLSTTGFFHPMPPHTKKIMRSIVAYKWYLRNVCQFPLTKTY